MDAGSVTEEEAVTTQQDQPRDEAQFFTHVRGWGITRGENGVFGGVVEGVGERIGMDRVPARLIAIVLALITSGLFLAAYAAAWAILPDSKGRIIAQDFGRGTPNVPALIGIGIFGLIGLNGLAWTGPLGWGWIGVVISTIVGLAIVVGIIALIALAVSKDEHGRTHVVVEFKGADQAKARAKTAATDAKTAAKAFTGEMKTSGRRLKDEGRATARRAKVAADEIRAAVTSQPATPSTESEDSTGSTPPVRPAHAPYLRPRVPGPGRTIRLLALSASFLSAAFIWWLNREDYLSVSPVEAWFAVAIVIVGLAIIAAGAAGRRIGVFGFWAVVLIAGWCLRIAAGPEVDRLLNSHEVFFNLDGKPHLISVNPGTVDCRDFDWSLVNRASDTSILASDHDYRFTLTQNDATILVPAGASVTLRSTAGDVETTLSWERFDEDGKGTYFGTCDIDGPSATFSTIGENHRDVAITITPSVTNIVIEEQP